MTRRQRSSEERRCDEDTACGPDVNKTTTDRPDACRYCGHWRLHCHATVGTPVRDQQVSQVSVQRYRCAGCGRTFRHNPREITAQDQSQRTVVLAALLYGLGLSCAASATFLSALGIQIRHNYGNRIFSRCVLK